MKSLITAAALLAVGATAASAQFRPYDRREFRYEERHHDFCQQAGREFFELQRLDRQGRSSHNTRVREIRLKQELDARCRGFRHRD